MVIKMFYPEELIEDIRQKNDIVDVISSYIKLQKKGRSYMGLCPFHNEKSPSFSVSLEKQMYHCFGCGAGGNVITFIMEYENFTFAESLKFLGERVGIKLNEVEYSKEARQQADLKGRMFQINKQAAKYYYYQLKSKQGSLALGYLKKRGLSDKTIQKFGLGYSNKFSDDLYRYLKQTGYEDDLLKQSGLVIMNEAKGVHDRFWNRVMFPIMDVNHKVIGFGGRVMGEGSPKYLNSPETYLFDKSRNLFGLNIARTSRKRKILLCEGYMDVIGLYQAGFDNAVASLGTAFTGLQSSLLKRYADEVLLSYDSDQAGVKAALRAIPILKEAGLIVKVINLKPYKDPDEFIKALGAEEFQKRIDAGKNSFYFEIEILESEYDLKDPEQKTRFFNETAKKLLTFTEEIERNNYIEGIGEKYKIAFEDLRKLVYRFGTQIVAGGNYQPGIREDYNQKKKKMEDGFIMSQKILLTWLCEDISLFEKIKGIISPSDFKESLSHKAAEMLFEQYKEGKVNSAKIINCFESKEEQKEAASLFMTNVQTYQDGLQDSDRNQMSQIEKEKIFNETIIRIKKHSLDYAAKHAVEAEELQKIIEEQANLQKLHISL